MNLIEKYDKKSMEDIAKLKKASSDGEDMAREMMRSYGTDEHVIDKVTDDARQKGKPINWLYGSSESIINLADYVETVILVYQPFPFRVDISKFKPDCSIIFENFTHTINEKVLTIEESEVLLRLMLDITNINFIGWETATVATYYPTSELMSFIANLILKYDPGDLLYSATDREETITFPWWQNVRKTIMSKCNIPRLEYIIEQMHLPDVDVDLAISQRNIESLIQALDFYLFRVTEKVKQALVEINEPSNPSLISALNNKKSNVRKAVVDILGKIKDPVSVNHLVGILRDDDILVRMAAGNALVNIGKPAIPALITALTDRDKNTKKTAAETLGKLKDTQSIKPIIQLFMEVDSGIRFAAQRSLHDMGKPAIPLLIEALENDNNDIRSGAATVLGDAKATESVDHLCGLLNSKCRSDRISALKALNKIASPTSTKYIIKVLKDKDKDIHQACIRALGSIGDAQALMPLLDIAKKDKDARQHIFQAIGAISQKSTAVSKDIIVPVIQELIKMLGDKYTWSYASSVLIVMDYPVVDYLYPILRNGKNQLVRKHVPQILAEKANKESKYRNEIIDLLCECLRDKDKEVKTSAAFALERVQDPRAIDALTTALEDADIRFIAEIILKKIRKIE